MVYCSSCGQSYKGGSFCEHCGVRQDSASGTLSNSKNLNRRKILIPSALVLVVVVAVAVGFSFKKSPAHEVLTQVCQKVDTNAVDENSYNANEDLLQEIEPLVRQAVTLDPEGAGKFTSSISTFELMMEKDNESIEYMSLYVVLDSDTYRWLAQDANDSSDVLEAQFIEQFTDACKDYK